MYSDTCKCMYTSLIRNLTVATVNIQITLERWNSGTVNRLLSHPSLRKLPKGLQAQRLCERSAQVFMLLFTRAATTLCFVMWDNEVLTGKCLLLLHCEQLSPMGLSPSKSIVEQQSGPVSFMLQRDLWSSYWDVNIMAFLLVSFKVFKKYRQFRYL